MSHYPRLGILEHPLVSYFKRNIKDKKQLHIC